MDPKQLLNKITNFLKARVGAASKVSEVDRGTLLTLKAELTKAVRAKDRVRVNEIMPRAVHAAVKAGVFTTV